MEQNKEILELLRKMEETGRKRARDMKILCCLGALMLVCCIAAVTAVLRFLPELQETVTQIQGVMGNLEKTTQQLAAMDFAGMASNVDALVTTGQESLKQTMDKLNTIDFEALNDAIEDLGEVVRRLSGLFNLFG